MDIIEILLSWNVWMTLGGVVMATTAIAMGYKNGTTRAYKESITALNTVLHSYKETDARQQTQIDHQSKEILRLQKQLHQAKHKIDTLTEVLTKIHKEGEVKSL